MLVPVLERVETGSWKVGSVNWAAGCCQSLGRYLQAWVREPAQVLVKALVKVLVKVLVPELARASALA